VQHVFASCESPPSNAEHTPSEQPSVPIVAATGFTAARWALSARRARRVLGDSQEAEDVLHEVFLEVWERRSDYDASRGPWRLLVMRARLARLDRLRALWSSSHAVERFVRVEATSSQPAPADTLSVRRALSNLAPELRTCWSLATSRACRRLKLPSTSNWRSAPLSPVWHAASPSYAKFCAIR